MDKNARRRLHRASAEKRLRYSVRKFNVGVASVAVAAFMFLGGNAVAANTLAKTDSPSTSTEKTGTVPDSEGKSGPDTSKSTAESVVSSEAPSSQVADKAVKSEATSKSEAALKEATSQVSEASVANSQSATSAAKSEATSEATSTASSSEAVAQSTAVESGKSSIENVTSKAASLATTSQTSTAIARSEANSTLAAAQREVDKGYADFRKSGESGFRSFDPQTGKTTVTKENFLDYFRLNGSATYNQYDGIVTLTPDEEHKTGNFSLKSKINMNQSFKLTGWVNLGDKTQDRYGADGIGFAFHTGNTTDLGANGGNLGIGGLRNATGFKLDTFWNVHTPPRGNRFDTSTTDSFQYGWAADPNLGQFGAWVNTTFKKVKGQGWFADEYERWWAETDASSAQRLDSSDLDGRFHDFAIQYDGVTKELTVAYRSNLGVKQWKKKVNSPEELMSMVVTATTGNYKNLQQFKIKRFDFYQSASVDVRYEDEQGRELSEGSVTYPQGAYKGKAYTTEQKKIPGYGFIGMKRGSLPPSGTLADWGTNGTVTYVYRKGAADVKTEKQTVTRKIEYRYRDGQTAGRPALPQTVTQTAEFTRTVTGGRPGPWSPSSQNLAAVNTPSITGFTPDKTRVDATTVDATSSPGTEIVYYDKIAPRVTTETKDVTRTVTYEYEDGVTSGRPALPREVQQNVQFTRQVSEDPATGQKTYGNWTPSRQTVDAVDTPAIKGFTPNKTRVNSASVSPTDPSWREIVSYRKNNPKVTTETKDVTRTVAYEYEDGVTRNRPALPQPVEQTVQFTRQVSEDPVTGQKTYGNWTPSRQTVGAVDSPEVAGFTPSKPRVNSASVSPTDPSWREIVSYAPATQRGTIVYRTDGRNGVPAKTLHTDNVSGKSDTPVNYTTTDKINEFKQQGYDLVSDGFTKAGGQRFDSNNNVDQTWEVVLTPRIETKQETKDVTRNVRYQYKDGVTTGRPALPRPVTQTTTFTRPVSVNKVTGVETPGQWNKQSEALPKVDSPAVTGFTPDKPSVPAATVTPTSPNEDEVVSYSQDDQRGSIKYVTDGKNGVPVKTLYTDSVTGKSGEPVAYSTVNRLTQLQQAGYKLVSDGFTQPNGQKFDNDKTKDQTWTVVVTPRLDDNTNPADLNSKVTRTIKYQYADGQTAGRPALKAPVTQEAAFTRTGKVNAVTGEKTFTPWTPATKELAQEGTPVVTGFVADKANVAAKTVKAGDANSEEVVQYKKLGSYVPNVPDGLPKVPNLPYPNDPNNPTKPGTDLPVVPHVPGTTPVGPDGTTPLTPKDPSNPSKGYNPPPIPNDPTQDTPISYVKDGQKAIITFVDQDANNKEVGKVVESGKSGEPIGTTNYAARLKELTDKGYEVVNDEFKGPKNFDNDDKKDQQFVVTLRQGKEPITDPAKLNSKVTRTIKYQYADGQTAGRPALKAPVTQEAAFTRTGERNRVTGVETFGAWTPATKELAQEATPVVTGFVADKANVAAKTVKAGDANSEEVVQYKKLGSYVPNVPDGLPKVPNLPYPNDPNNPTKPGTDLPVVPHVPGTTPVGPDGTTPLTPKDPSDPSKGYNPPPIPNDPTQDTPISYVKDGQKAIITFVDQDANNKEVGKVVESGKSGEPIGTTNYAARLKELTDKGYEVVNDEFKGPKNFDNDDKKDQQFVVTLRQGKEPITDPAKLNSKVTRTIKYQYADGQTAGRPALKAPVTQEAAFTRTGERNRVTGVETFGAWTPATKELAQEATPVVTGFVADKANVAAKTVKAGDANSEEVVQYKKLGSYVPNVPDGLPKVPNLPYPNDPNNPTKPGTDLPVVPHVPGTTPVGPDGTTPLTPKDPSDPSKGYNPPPIPNDPTQDTPISYVKDGQKAIITFVDQDANNKEVGKVVESGKSGEPIGTTNYAARLKELTDKGYEVVNDEFAGPKNFDNDDKKDQTFTVTLRQGTEKITDPAKLNKKVSRTIKYEYADGQTAGRPALKAPVTQEAAFTRTGERNRVTGVETFGAWTPATKELAQEATPVVTGFVADKANVAAKTVTPDDKDSEETVKYSKLGSYVPNVPDGLPKVPNLPYPNDPTDPSKPGTDLPVIPHVPGTTPVGPDGTTPLTPKDPSDPSKGYNPPPVPSDPTKDTPINYVKDGQKAIISFVDQTDGNKELTKVVESGKSGEPIGTTNYAARLKELTDKGYEVVNDEFAGPKNFDNDDKKDQTFTVTLRQGTEKITDPAKLNKKVSRTIKYEYADGQTAGRPALKAPVTQEAAFTRTGERNRVTGVETFGAWTPATKELAQEATPVVTGFVADKANVAAKTVTPDDKDSEETVKYSKLGSYVPNVPDGLPKVPNLPYPNDPTDPSKPGTDLPVIPHVPGTTPVGPDGTTPLTPKDPSDPSKGYNPPPVPSDPTKDTPINYVKDGQKAIISFVDQTDGNKELTKVVESGKSGEPIGTTNYAARLKELTDKGYEVVNDEFAGPKNFDNDDKKDQTFTVTLRQGTEKITDPAKLNKKVSRTIKYEYADGQTAGRPALKAPVTQEAAFTRTGERNRVTGVETFGAWTPATKELAQEATPVVTGFVADKANVAAKTVKAGDANSEEVVQYKKLGSYVPNVPDGLPKVPNLPYPNDPNNPTKPGTDLPVVPHVPGTTPVGPDGTTPLTPKDPSDPSKGYNPPPIPNDPTQDTPINYVKDGQKAIISFVDQTDGNKELTKVVESGKSGEPIGTTNYAARLKELTDKGYEVVNDEFAGPKNFDNDDKKDQTFTVTLRQGTEKITDPAKLNKKVSRTIKYEYADGQTAGRPALKAPVTQEAAFTRTGERNRVTGVETFGAWTPATKELAQEATPVVTGFVADKANVAAKTVTPDDKDSEETVKYSKLGSYVPNVPDGLPKVPNLPYPNDPTDPSKPGTDLPVIPHVPGTTPVGPDGTTPLTPKDPSDPSKGYNPPPVPSDPTKDTPINYVKDGQKAIISFVDQTDGNKELTKVVESGKSGEPIGTTNYAARLKELTDKGYEVVNDEFAGPKNFDNDDKKDQTFTVTLRQGTEKITDPAKLNKKVSRTIKYEYADGQTAGRPALKAPVTQEAAFTRTGERNRVTGVETFGAWTPATKELAQEATPVVTGFVADKANVAAKTVTPDDKDSEETVKYSKLGSYVPNVPDGLPKVPNLPYPNDPTDPSKPGTDLPVIPHVPGTTPVGPDGTTPLTPKDPSDPSKGYNPPPVPSDPTKDTPINYVKDGQKAIISFVDQTDGNKELTKVVESGKSGEPIGTTNYAARLKELTDKGYEVVNDEFAGPKNFDNDDKKDQTFTVTLRQGTEKITDPAKLNKKVSRTIKYEYADGQTAGRPALKAPVTQEAAFTRTGERNRVTGVETFGAWTPATKELAQEATPVVTGFVADKANVAAKTVTPDDKDSEETVKYSKLGSYVPNVPDGLPKVPNLPYPNDPTDPSKPGTDLPVIPHVPGTTPVGPDGTTPLTPKDPSDPSKGYNPPPVPSDPTKDTPINYVKDGQKAIISFVDQTDGNKELTKVVESGKSGEPIGTTNYAARLKELTDKGYEVVNDEFAGPKNFDNDDKKDQTFTVTLRQGTEKITDPAKLNKKVSRTIKYEYADGQTAGRPALKAPVTQEAAFTRTGERNRVTGVETFGAWTPATKELAQEATPVVTGFVADKANVAAKTVTPDDKDSEETVKYSKLGSYVPNVPDGLPKVPNLPYPNDPTDPSKPGTDLPVIPHVPGTTPVGPDGTTPLTPKDPSDPSKGYNPPPVPSDPTKDTPINYVKDGQKAIISFVDQTDGNKELTKVVESGKSGEPIGTTNYAARLKELTDKGYEVVNDEFAGPKNFDNDDKKDQTFTVTLRQGTEKITDPAKLNKKVSRTIKYEYADGQTAGRPALKAPVTQEAAFTRTGERNRVTGVETFGAWTPATKELAQEATPVVTGFVADKANVAAKTVTPDDKDSEETVKYSKLGSYVPNVPDGLPKVPNLPYPNDPTDPSKPGTDLPVIPHVPGTTPVGPDGTTPLTPKDPSDPSKGYNPPPVPSDPTKDTPINYVKDGQKAIISFVDQTDGNKELTKVVESGKSGEPIGTTNYAARLKELTDKGYEVVNDEFAGPKNFDNDDKKDQTFTVTLRQGTEKITDPAKLNKKVSRTIKYEYADGQTAGRPALKAPVTQEAAFTRTGERNRVTGVETFGAWTPATKELAQEATPVVTGFVADKANVAAKTVTPDDKDSEETVKYSKLGSYVPNVPDGLPKVPNLPYPNDPTDPSKPGTDLPVIPHVPGTTPVGPDGTTPLTPKDPSDPSKGYNPPPVPSDPTKDTPINYVKDGQKAIISFVDQTDGNKELTKVVESGKSGEPIGTTNYAARLKELTDKGYEVVNDEFAGPKNFDNDDKKDQTFTVTLRQGTEKITDPAKLNKKVSRTIKYEYADGQTAGRPALKAPVTQEAAFTRTGERNRVTGVETFGAWTPATKELAQEATPVVTGFVADKANVAAKTVTPDDKDSEETVKYSKLGSYVPNVPDGLPKVPNLPYPNDPTDPSKPGTDLPVIPHVPGTTPVGPDGTTPLTPKDPSDPSKGYNPPPVPSDPTKDTPINYVKDGQKAIISFVDQTDGNKELTKVVESGKSGEPIGTTNYAARLKELTDKGYEVVNDEFAGPKNFDNDDKKDQTFTVTLRQAVVPFDPNNPPKPNDPMDPKNPDGPKWTDDKIKSAQQEAVKELSRTITYVYEDGKEAAPSFTDSAKFTRILKVNVVTKEIVEKGAWTSQDDVIKGQTSPDIKGYVADKASVADVKVTADSAKPADEVVTYKKADQKATITFVDQAKKELAKVSEGGKSGEPISRDQYLAKLKELTNQGYKVVNDEFKDPQNFDDDASKDQNFTVQLEESVVPFDPNNPPKPNDPMDPKNPDGPKWTDDKIKSAQQEAVKELSRTITYVYEDGKEAAPSFTDSAKFTRILKVNVVTKEIVEKGAWTSQDDVIKGQTSPDIKGYVADKASVADVKVTADSAKPADEVVTYKKADQKATITFVDQAKKELAKVSEGGKSGEPISRDQYLAKLKELTNQGYKVVNDEFKDPQNFDDDASKDQNFTVQLEESVVPFDPNNPPKPNDPMDPKNPDGPKWTDDKIKSAQQEAVKELSRTITYVYEDGKEAAPSFTDSAKFTRILKVNVVTKEIVEKGAWTSQDDVIKGQTSPDIKGYVADKASVADVKVTADSAKPADEVVTYKKADQKATITFVDQAKKELAKVSEGGKSGEPISRDQYLAKLKELTNQGYKVVNDEFKDPQNFDDDASKDQNFTVQLEESVVPFDPNNPPKPNDPMDPKNPDGPKWTDDKIKSAQQEAVKELSRTITYVYEDGKEAAPSFTDSAKFTRILKVNVVTKEIVEKGAWTSQDDVIKGQTSPDIKGYVADKASVADVKVTADSAKPADEVVTYKKADQKATITFVDQAKKELAKVSEGGKSGEPISRDQYLAKLKELTNQGYKVVNDEFKDPQNFDDDASKDQNFTVQLEESVVPFDPNNPPKPNDPMDPKNPDGPKWTDDKIKSAQQEAVKELSRTITYVYEDGKEAAPSFTDSAKFTRILKVNVVTKEIVEKGAWTSQDDVIKGQTSPDIKGYVADKASVADVKVTADSAKPADEVVTYKKADQKATITFVDQAKKELAKVSEGGKSGEPISRDQYLAKLKELTNQGYKVVNDEFKDPQNFDDDASKDQNFTVQLEESVVPFDPNNPPKPNDPMDPKNPDGPKWTDDKIKSAQQEAVKELSRTITYVYEDGKEAAPSFTDSAKFTRILKVNVVTKEIVEKGAWTSQDDVIKGQTSPDIKGYVADKASVADVKVTADSAKPADEVVTYKKADQKATITFVDQAKKELAKVSEGGKSGEPISRDQYLAKLKELTNQGYKVVNDEFKDPQNFDDDASKDQNFTVQLEESVVPFDPNNPPKPNDPMDPKNPDGPKWTDDKIKSAQQEAVKELSRTITYVYEDGKEAAPSFTDSAKFTRILKVNVVTKEIVEKGAWTSQDDVIKGQTSPDIKGYVADKASVADVKVTADSAKPADEVVTYKKAEVPPTPVPPAPTPAPAPAPAPNKPVEPRAPRTAVLPNTGEESSSAAVLGLGIAAALAGISLIKPRLREEEE